MATAKAKRNLRELDALLDRLLKRDTLHWDSEWGKGENSRIPKKGIYLLLDGKKPMYVGKSDRLRDR